MSRPPRSAAVPMLLTVLVLVGLTFSVADFRRPTIHFTILDAPGSPPVLRRGRSYEFQGVVSDRDNIYRRITDIHVHLTQEGRLSSRTESWKYDRSTGWFDGRLWISENEREPCLEFEVYLYDQIGRLYGRGQIPLPDNRIPLRVE